MSPKIWISFLCFVLYFSNSIFSDSSYIPGQLLIRKKNISALHLSQSGSLETVIQEQGGTFKKLPLRYRPTLKFRGGGTAQDVELITVDPKTDLDALSARLSQLPDVDLVQKNYRFHLFYSPNDPDLAKQWHIGSVRLNEAWDISQGSSSVVIAVIDSGVDYNHPDLVNIIWHNPFVTDSTDTDGNAQSGDAIGWDFGSTANGGAGDNDPMDNMGHGTLVAGTAAAQTDNSVGGAGAAFNARIMPIKVTNDRGDIDTATLLQAVNYATFQQVNVINLSLGGTEPDAGKNSLLENAINTAIDNGIVVVAAAGNIETTAFDIDDAHIVPATYPRVLTVGGANMNGDYDDEVSLFGNSVDIIAPDVGIYGPAFTPSTKARGFRTGTGTSFAAPIVSGVCALLKAANPNATPEDIERTLVDTAEDKGTPGKDKFTGYGLLDAEAALSALQTGPLISFSDSLSSYYSAPVTVSVTISDTDGVSLNSISATINTETQTLSVKPGDAGVTFLGSTLTLLPSVFSSLTVTNTLVVTVRAADANGLFNSKKLTLYKSNSLAIPTVLNAPNPFDPSKETTTFHIELTQDADVDLTLYSLALKPIKTFPQQHLTSGYHMDLTWDGKDDDGDKVPNGVYVLFVKAKNGTNTAVKRYKVAVLRR